MSYELDAGLDGRSPYLRVLEADSGCVRLAWRYPAPEERASPADADTALQELFRELFLLTTADYLKQGDR
jgi:hypothetical protein